METTPAYLFSFSLPDRHLERLDARIAFLASLPDVTGNPNGAPLAPSCPPLAVRLALEALQVSPSVTWRAPVEVEGRGALPRSVEASWTPAGTLLYLDIRANGLREGHRARVEVVCYPTLDAGPELSARIKWGSLVPGVAYVTGQGEDTPTLTAPVMVGAVEGGIVVAPRQGAGLVYGRDGLAPCLALSIPWPGSAAPSEAPAPRSRSRRQGAGPIDLDKVKGGKEPTEADRQETAEAPLAPSEPAAAPAPAADPATP